MHYYFDRIRIVLLNEAEEHLLFSKKKKKKNSKVNCSRKLNSHIFSCNSKNLRDSAETVIASLVIEAQISSYLYVMSNLISYNFGP